MDYKMLTVRVAAHEAAKLEAVARAKQASVADEVRAAISSHVDHALRDRAVIEVIDQERRLLDELVNRAGVVEP